jgi:sarcosine oxidase subunit gamma
VNLPSTDIPDRRIALVDLATLPRFGMKGVATRPWIEEQGYHIGNESNMAYPQDNGSLVARLSPAELLFLSDPLNPKMNHDHDYFGPGRDCYFIRRQDSHYWFAIIGQQSDTMLAKLCGVDFNQESFANHLVAQTRVAGTSAIVIRHTIEDRLCYYILGDRSYTEFMRESLMDAMFEFDGLEMTRDAIAQLTPLR